MPSRGGAASSLRPKTIIIALAFTLVAQQVLWTTKLQSLTTLSNEAGALVAGILPPENGGGLTMGTASKKKVPTAATRSLQELIQGDSIQHFPGTLPLSSTRVIFQTVKDYSVPEKIKECMESWSTVNPQWHRLVFDDAAASKLIHNTFNDTIGKVYDSLPMGAMKSDVFRYVIIYLYGGVYADADATCNIPIETWYPPTELRKIPQANCSLIIGSEYSGIEFPLQWVVGPAEVRSPIMKNVVDLVLKRIFLPMDLTTLDFVHETTGPRAYGEGVMNAVGLPSRMNIHQLAVDYKSGTLENKYATALTENRLCVMDFEESDSAQNNQVASRWNDFDDGWPSWLKTACQLYAASNPREKVKKDLQFRRRCKDVMPIN